MKKFKIMMCLLFLIFCLPYYNINAAYSYVWTVDGETITIGNSNSMGNVRWDTDDKYSGGVLTLDNYNGGQISISSVGSGLSGQIFAIKLVGDNKITADGDFGILSMGLPIVFIGDGTLEIEAPVPISNSMYGYMPTDFTTIDDKSTIINWQYSMNVKISPSVEQVNEQISGENIEKTENNEQKIEDIEEKENINDTISDDVNLEKDNTKNDLSENWILYYCITSTIIIIILIVVLFKKRKK